MKNILIISKFFAPINKVASVRLTKVGKYLTFNDFCVDVVTVKYDKYIVDPILSEDLKHFNSIIRLDDYDLIAAIKGKIKLIRNRLKNQKNPEEAPVKSNSLPISKKKYSRDNSLKRFIKNSNYIISEYFQYLQFKKQKIDFNSYEYLLSSYGPISNHMIARYIKKKYPQIKWIADFRDAVYSHTYTTVFRNYYKSYEKRYCKNADAITVAAQGCMDNLNIDFFTKPKYVITNGYDPDDIKNIEETDSPYFNINYTGQLYLGRSDLSPVFEVLKKLTDSNAVSKEKIRFEYAGNGYQLVYSMASKYGMEDILINHGVVSREKSLKIQKSSKMLVLASWNTKKEKGILTGKFFEYMMMDKPIIAAVSGDDNNSILKELINLYNLGIAYEEANHKEDMQALEEYILKQYENYINGKKIEHKPNNGIDKYNYNMLTQNFIDIFLSI